ncbi:MAG: hypothetical protein ACP5QR_12550, partial [Rhizomicrobium sp.]
MRCSSLPSSVRVACSWKPASGFFQRGHHHAKTFIIGTGAHLALPYPVYTSFLNFPLISMAALDSLGLGA